MQTFIHTSLFIFSEKPDIPEPSGFSVIKGVPLLCLRLAETSVVVLLACGSFEFLYDKGVVLPFICQKLIELYIVLFIYYVVY